MSLERCREASDIADLVASTLEAHGGVRFYNTIGEACQTNHRRLFADGAWDETRERLETLREARARSPRTSDAETEREGCRFLSDGVGGEGLKRIGSKHSRDVLQVLGLTRYETPLDSRITKWMNRELELRYEISASGLDSPEFYNFHMDLVQAICDRADELLCVFDAAVFSSYDDGWSEDAVAAAF